jgi:hypothetical protein
MKTIRKWGGMRLSPLDMLVISGHIIPALEDRCVWNIQWNDTWNGN